LWEVKHHMDEPQLNLNGTLATDCVTLLFLGHTT
jgi:hypothetical protein